MIKKKRAIFSDSIHEQIVRVLFSLNLILHVVFLLFGHSLCKKQSRVVASSELPQTFLYIHTYVKVRIRKHKYTRTYLPLGKTSICSVTVVYQFRSCFLVDRTLYLLLKGLQLLFRIVTNLFVTFLVSLISIFLVRE